jgi:hypothetical protein
MSFHVELEGYRLRCDQPSPAVSLSSALPAKLFASIKLRGAPCASTGKARRECLQIRLRSLRSGLCRGVPQPSLATTSATISSTPDGSVASAAASAVKSPVSASAREHHGDEHLKPLHADATVTLPTVPFAAVLRVCRGVCACVRASACTCYGPFAH